MNKELTKVKALLAHPIYSEIYKKVHTTGSFFCLVTGALRSGKSYAAMRLAYDLDVDPRTGENRFTVDRIVFSPVDFLTLMQQRLPKGSAIVWDEVGAAAPRREWYTLRNRLISQVFQTCGFKNRIIFMTVPSMTFVDAHIQILLNGHLHMHAATNTDYRVGVFYFTEYDEDKNELIRRLPATHGLIKVTHKPIIFRKPPAHLVRAYEERFTLEKQRIIEHAKDQLDYMKIVLGVKKAQTADAELYKRIKERFEFFLNSQGLVDVGKVILEFGVSHSTAKRVAKLFNDEIKAKQKAEKEKKKAELEAIKEQKKKERELKKAKWDKILNPAIRPAFWLNFPMGAPPAANNEPNVSEVKE